MKLGLQAKFALLIGLLLTILFSIITIAVIRSNTSTLRNNLLQQSRAFAELSSTPIGNSYLLYKDSGRIKILQEIERFADLNPSVKNVYIINTAGEILFSQHETGSSGKITEAETVFATTVVDRQPDGSLRIASPFIENFGLRRFTIVYDISSASINQNIMQVTVLIAVLGALGLIFTTVLMYVLVNRFFIQPIRQVGAAAVAVNAGNLEYNLGLERSDEIGELSNSVKGMAERLKADIKKLTHLDELKSEFMMITSHNLRTPISIMRGYLELLGDKPVSQDIKDIINKLDISTNRLKGFAEDILTISTIESGDQSLTMSPGDIGQLVKSIAEEYRGIIEEKQLVFEVNIPADPIMANLSEAHMGSAIWNLLHNAYKFTPAGGRVSLAVSQQGGQAKITITDTGIGIADEEKANIFTKFHRATSMLTYEHEGTGIGLYITKMIIELHGGTIDFASVLGKGTTFTVLLPIMVE